MKRFPFLVLIFAMIQVNACAFKGAPGSGQAANSGPPASASARVLWWAEDQKKSTPLVRNLDTQADAKLMRTSTPVTLPAHTPNRIEIELSYPTHFGEFSATNLSIQAVPINGQAVPLTPVSVNLLSRTDDWTDAVIDLDGIRPYFSDDKEATLDLRFLLQKTSGETSLTMVVSLRTPPALLKFDQAPMQESDLEGVQDRNSLKHLDIGREQFHLLQVGRVKNYSSYPLSVEIPSLSKALLKIDRTHYFVQAAGDCGFDASMDHKKVPLRGEVRLFPLSESLTQTLTAHDPSVNAALRLPMTIAPNQSSRFGIYVSGPDAALISESRFQKQKAVRVRMPDHCEARCNHKRMAASEFALCWSGGRNNLYKVPYSQIQDCLDCGAGNQRACDSCSGWETRSAVYQQAGPNCLFCGELAVVGNLGGSDIYKAIIEWHQETVFIDNALSGDEDGLISIDASTLDAQGLVRFADAPEQDDPQARAVPLLKASQAQDKPQ